MTAATLEIVKKHKGISFGAMETMAVLKSDIRIYWSWGVSNTTIMQENGQPIAIVMKVNGHHHKGNVIITLNGNDTYRVVIASVRAKVLNVYEEVYVDELRDLIDNRIEKIADYVY